MEVKDLQPNRLLVSPGPHISTPVSTRRLMGNVVIALLPTLVAATIIFGLHALLLTLVTVAACVVFEYLWCRLRRTPSTVGDLSCIVTGLLLAYNLPPALPLYIAVIGAFVAIIITKELFGGIGCNFANPAIVGRIVLAVSFTSQMTTYTYPATLSGLDALSSATPLALYKTMHIPFLDLLLGTHGGVLGETCAVTLIAGFIFLVATGTIEITIPVVYVGTVAVFSALCGYDVPTQIFGGGLMLGAIFMATDYVTSPFTRLGKIVFGLGLGLITCAIRFWGNMNEGVSYSILLMNLLVPFINERTRKTPLGGGKKA